MRRVDTEFKQKARAREARHVVESCYKLDCHACGHTLELPAEDGQANCPPCGAELTIQWAAERAVFDQERPEAEPIE